MTQLECDCSEYGYGPAEFYRARISTAKKEYKCCECGGTIKPGDKYEYVSAKWDGQFSALKTCMTCVNIRIRYCPNGFLHGGLQTALEECLGFDYTKVPEYEEEIK